MSKPKIKTYLYYVVIEFKDGETATDKIYSLLPLNEYEMSIYLNYEYSNTVNSFIAYIGETAPPEIIAQAETISTINLY
jgi:hypothetical protein